MATAAPAVTAVGRPWKEVDAVVVCVTVSTAKVERGGGHLGFHGGCAAAAECVNQRIDATTFPLARQPLLQGAAVAPASGVTRYFETFERKMLETFGHTGNVC